MMSPEVVDSEGRPVPLGTILGKGYEGTVYEVAQSSTIAAKVYHQPLSVDRSEKIRTMVRTRTDALAKLTSWPLDLLLVKSTKRPIGLLMPLFANRKNVHHLYGPKSRLRDFPKADWRFLVHAAANIAKAFATVHDANCVIGDVNHSSVLVAQDATVALIDCDSFQVNTPERRFLCDVGVETFTPPELQGIPFRGIVRTPNFDGFGLAVMIFHLLFMGRHPFAGRPRGPGDVPIAQAIKEYRFPYSANHIAMGMDRPPGMPPLSLVGTAVAQLFETAFSRAAVKSGRPTAREWAAALLNLEANIRRCGTYGGHCYPSHLSSCPWCEMEAHGANPLFPVVAPAAVGPAGARTNIETLWRQIQALGPLGPAPIIPLPVASPTPAAQRAKQTVSMAKPIATVAALALLAGGTILAPPAFWIFALLAFGVYNLIIGQFQKGDEIGRFRRTLADAEANFNRANADWQHRAGDGAYREAKLKFESLRTAANEIPSKRMRALDQLKRDQRKLQLDRFLDRFDIEDAQIEGIGAGRKRTLESYGIETAKDIDPRSVSAVPGFGPKRLQQLMKWRASLIAKFVFNPAEPIDPRDIAKVERDILTLRGQTEAAAQAAFNEVLQAHARVVAVRRTMRPQMDAFQTAVAQARADYACVNQ